MKRIVLRFVGGDWDGRSIRSDSPEQEEVFLATGYYEMSHHGLVGSECVGLSDDAVAFAKHHGWDAAKNLNAAGEHRYRVCERRETETAIIVTLRHVPSQHVKNPPATPE